VHKGGEYLEKDICLTAFVEICFMKTKKPQPLKNNYLSGPDELQCLTNRFRSNLKEWCDENNKIKTVEINGETKPLMMASISEVLNYAMEYTNKWKPIPDQNKEDFKDIWFIDCRGLYIDFSPSVFLNIKSESTEFWAPVQFNHSVISDNYHLFVRKKFLGYAHFYDVKFLGDIHFNESQFHGEVNFDKASFERAALFSDCEFLSNKGASFQYALFLRRADFTNARFNRTPVFHDTKLPQASSFDGATFTPIGEKLLQNEIIALRTLRQIAASYKDQKDEAKFFALEQRYYRKLCLAPRLEWKKWRAWPIRWSFIEWFISWAYDFISEYGSNPKRPLVQLVIFNLAIWFIYQYAFIFGDCVNSDFCLNKDPSIFAQQNPVLYFVLQNLFNSSTVKTAIIVNNKYMLFWGIFQFIVSYLILVLAALAIRTRFQKGGGG
jgi:uncharacterized protein YjbI with pentapeptide repeats